MKVGTQSNKRNKNEKPGDLIDLPIYTESYIKTTCRDDNMFPLRPVLPGPRITYSLSRVQ